LSPSSYKVSVIPDFLHQFVQLISNPWYLNHLASQNLLENQSFISYLAYLQYWKEPQYAQFLTYPGPTLKTLELLQQEPFRKNILAPALMMQLVDEYIKATPSV
jgi:mediator of RNA polymerase II transcription subunit 31